MADSLRVEQDSVVQICHTFIVRLTSMEESGHVEGGGALIHLRGKNLRRKH